MTNIFSNWGILNKTSATIFVLPRWYFILKMKTCRRSSNRVYCWDRFCCIWIYLRMTWSIMTVNFLFFKYGRQSLIAYTITSSFFSCAGYLSLAANSFLNSNTTGYFPLPLFSVKTAPIAVSEVLVVTVKIWMGWKLKVLVPLLIFLSIC